MGEPLPPAIVSESPVQLVDCIEELLKFTLEAYVDGTLGIDLALSKDYCSHLLREDFGDSNFDITGTFGGVPLYPLYKSLASALNQCIAFCRMPSVLLSSNEDKYMKKKEEWSLIFLNHRSQILNMLKAIEFEFHVQEPFFSQIRVGAKTIEGRCAVGDYKRIVPGALILINKCLLVEVQDLKKYALFSEMLVSESLEKVLPGVKKIEEGLKIYQKFYTKEKERSNGVLAIRISILANQPYISLASVLFGLSYEGIQSLLGLMHTAGTIPEALPPPRSALLASFMMPHNPNVKGSSLTEGARALSKHVERSCNRWWGDFLGNDSNKNQIAVKVINHIISHCCWINIHIVPPYEGVLEIRVDEGYGARWSKDGTKFIGFLEPYMEDGHSKGWKH